MNIKRISLALFSSMVLSLGALAQNIQFHYDLGRYTQPTKQAGRPYTTLTVEQQSVDRFGDTFYFVDMSFQAQGAVVSNWKFLRNLRFWEGSWSWHLRYDGGLRFVDTSMSSPAPRAAFSIKDAFFTGVTYSYRRPDGKLMLSLTPTYKYIKGHQEPHNWEATLVWNYRPGSGLFSANGFFTYWREKMPLWDSSYRIMTQPQFWLNLDRLKGFSKDVRLSVGTEIRISHNVDARGFVVAPTLALKWNFSKS